MALNPHRFQQSRLLRARPVAVNGSPITARCAPDIVVHTRSKSATRAVLAVGHGRFPAAIGRSGIRAMKREGDGATPMRVMRLLYVMYHADKNRRPLTALSLTAMSPSDGWCDAVGDRNYNRAVTLPYPASTEKLERKDDLYDVVVVLDYNVVPRIQGRGSAIFMHVARPGYPPTEGCIALSLADLRRLLSVVKPGSRVLIASP